MGSVGNTRVPGAEFASVAHPVLRYGIGGKRRSWGTVYAVMLDEVLESKPIDDNS